MSTIDNLINISFTNAEINQMENALDTIENILNGKVVNLTPEQRQEYGNIGNNTENWITKVNRYMDQKPQLIPFYLSKPEFDKDLKARELMKPWLNRVDSINESMQDTSKLLSTDIYNAAIAYYRNIKLISRQNVPGTTTIYQDLKEQFPGRRTEVIEEPAPEAPNNSEEDERNSVE